MTFMRTPSRTERERWRPWFAWRPVRVQLSEETSEWAWLERVDRSWTLECEEGHCWWQGRYRLLRSTTISSSGWPNTLQAWSALPGSLPPPPSPLPPRVAR